MSLGGRYLSKRATDQYGFFFMPGFTTFDAAVHYRRAKIEYGLNISNVLNRTHYFISAIDDTQVCPGPPIDVSGAIRYRFWRNTAFFQCAVYGGSLASTPAFVRGGAVCDRVSL